MESLIERLRSLAKAYPEDVFPVLTKEQTWAHPEIVARASASMGRHFSTTFTEAADEIERLRKDAERYRWLRDIPGEQRADHDWNPGLGGWDAPIFWHGINKPGDELQGADLDAAIDAAMAGANPGEAAVRSQEREKDGHPLGDLHAV